jgi:hypothetical protein
MMEGPSSTETSVLTRATRRNITKDAILHNHRRENLKSYIKRRTFTCSTWYSTLKKEHNLEAFQTGILRRQFDRS